MTNAYLLPNMTLLFAVRVVMLPDMSKVALASTIVGGVGSFFAPASAAAAGGALTVVGACAVGGLITALPLGAIVSITLAQDEPKNLVYAAVMAELFVGSLCAAGVGATVFGAAVPSVFACSLMGASVLAAPVLAFCLGVLILKALYSCVCSDDNVFSRFNNDAF